MLGGSLTVLANGEWTTAHAGGRTPSAEEIDAFALRHDQLHLRD